MNWPALDSARRHDPSLRVPFGIGRRRVGSVAIRHLEALREWPGWIEITGAGVELSAPDADLALAQINSVLRDRGLVRGWRDEACAVVEPGSGRRLARIERAAARFWGTLTLGAHANGYVAGSDGRPAQLWIARRAATKATDPGYWDNLVGGGVPDGQSPYQTLMREGWEEAGIEVEVMRGARPGRVVRVRRDIAEGLQFEDLHVYDLALPAGLSPRNQDGEVELFDCLPLPQALVRAAGDTMTVDAALATLDFALRHRLPGLAPDATARFEALCVAGSVALPRSFATADVGDQTP